MGCLNLSHDYDDGGDDDDDDYDDGGADDVDDDEGDVGETIGCVTEFTDWRTGWTDLDRHTCPS